MGAKILFLDEPVRLMEKGTEVENEFVQAQSNRFESGLDVSDEEMKLFSAKEVELKKGNENYFTFGYVGTFYRWQGIDIIAENQEESIYDWVHEDQIKWYEEKAEEIKNMILCQKILLRCDYNLVGKLQYEIQGKENIFIGDSEYAEDVVISVYIPCENVDNFVNNIIDKTNGNVKVEKAEVLYFEKQN